VPGASSTFAQVAVFAFAIVSMLVMGLNSAVGFMNDS